MPWTIRASFFLPAGTLERVPETPAQRMPDLVVQQEVDRQRRTLQQPGLKVGRHARLAGQHRLQPQRRSVPCYRTAELLALLVRRLHSLRQRDAAAVLIAAGRGRAAHHRLRAAVGGAAGRTLNDLAQAALTQAALTQAALTQAALTQATVLTGRHRTGSGN